MVVRLRGRALRSRCCLARHRARGPDPAQDIAGMASCDEHLCAMKLTADFIHPHEHPCGIDGSRFRWPENECYTDWDELASPRRRKSRTWNSCTVTAWRWICRSSALQMRRRVGGAARTPDELRAWLIYVNDDDRCPCRHGMESARPPGWGQRGRRMGADYRRTRTVRITGRCGERATGSCCRTHGATMTRWQHFYTPSGSAAALRGR